MKILRFHITYFNDQGQLEMIGSSAFAGTWPNVDILSVGLYVQTEDGKLTHTRDATPEEKTALYERLRKYLAS
jgi:hypothetical protein